MKDVALTTGRIKLAGVETTTGTVDLICQSLDNPPPGGFSLSDFKERMRIDKAIESLPENALTLALEDQDYETLKKCVGAMRWTIRDKYIVEFVEQFE